MKTCVKWSEVRGRNFWCCDVNITPHVREAANCSFYVKQLVDDVPRSYRKLVLIMQKSKARKIICLSPPHYVKTLQLGSIQTLTSLNVQSWCENVFVLQCTDDTSALRGDNRRTGWSQTNVLPQREGSRRWPAGDQEERETKQEIQNEEWTRGHSQAVSFVHTVAVSDICVLFCLMRRRHTTPWEDTEGLSPD